MRAYVIQREDGAFVAPPGGEKSYTKLLQEALWFDNPHDPERERCKGNERVVAVADLVTWFQLWQEPK